MWWWECEGEDTIQLWSDCSLLRVAASCGPCHRNSASALALAACRGAARAADGPPRRGVPVVRCGRSRARLLLHHRPRSPASAVVRC